MSPTDITDAARMVAFALGKQHIPPRSSQYKDLVDRYCDDDDFAHSVRAIVRGFDLIPLDVNYQVGLVLGTTPETMFKTSVPQVVPAIDDRLIYLLAQLATATVAFPRPEDLDDIGYSGRVSVDQIDERVGAIMSALEQRATEEGIEVDPPTDRPGLEAVWRHYSRRPAAAKNRHDGEKRTTRTSLIRRVLKHLYDEKMLRSEGGDSYTTTALYQIHVRELASYDMLEELAELGIATLGTTQPPAPSDPANHEPQHPLWP